MSGREGFLWKKGQYNTAFKQRYFRLVDNQLFYFKTQDVSQPFSCPFVVVNKLTLLEGVRTSLLDHCFRSNDNSNGSC